MSAEFNVGRQNEVHNVARWHGNCCHCIHCHGRPDQNWSQRLANKFKYTGKISYFVRTSLPLDVDGKVIKGAVYQRLDQPDCFYVLPGDYVLAIGRPWPASPGVGGFTLSAPRSQNFLACMNCL